LRGLPELGIVELLMLFLVVAATAAALKPSFVLPLRITDSAPAPLKIAQIGMIASVFHFRDFRVFGVL
jgi:hypothetical protein